MSTTATTTTTITPAIIVGGGRVGRALQDMGDGRDVLVGRGQNVSADIDGPIFVCTRNDDLDAVLEATPSSRWSDLVFFQNGMLQPWLESRGLGDSSQVLAYFAVSKLGEPPVDGKTDTDPDGLTAVSGKWASAVAARLHSAGLSCKGDAPLTCLGRSRVRFPAPTTRLTGTAMDHTILQKEAFQKQMLEKLIWICSFMLVGARHPGATVGILEKTYGEEVTSLIAELRLAAAAERRLTFDECMEERLCAYSRAVAHFPTAVKEFKWRNGWFYSLTENSLALGKGDPCPLHTAWLKEINII
ncbi:hypothetical protein KSP40_PGU022273 [Platanthera guangdongensis]|uniref:Uncharacterized protein n=1 Tax=Platanthera guangdongensis TaxID=2320717 RepID=A0ABR2MLT8_9ASPA